MKMRVTFIAIVATAIIGRSEPLDDYTLSTLHWTPVFELTPTSTEVGDSFPFTAGKLSQVEGYPIRVGGSAIPNGFWRVRQAGSFMMFPRNGT